MNCLYNSLLTWKGSLFKWTEKKHGSQVRKRPSESNAGNLEHGEKNRKKRQLADVTKDDCSPDMESSSEGSILRQYNIQ